MVWPACSCRNIAVEPATASGLYLPKQLMYSFCSLSLILSDGFDTLRQHQPLHETCRPRQKPFHEAFIVFWRHVQAAAAAAAAAEGHPTPPDMPLLPGATAAKPLVPPALCPPPQEQHQKARTLLLHYPQASAAVLRLQQQHLRVQQVRGQRLWLIVTMTAAGLAAAACISTAAVWVAAV
jgi:hypothetical protein